MRNWRHIPAVTRGHADLIARVCGYFAGLAFDPKVGARQVTRLRALAATGRARRRSRRG